MIEQAVVVKIDDPDEKMDSTEEEVEVTKFTNWANEPEVRDLKQNYEDALPDSDLKKQEISTWLDNLNVEGSAKMKKIKGKSNIQPKLIRKQAEWRYAALSEPFLSTEDLFNVYPVTWEDREAAIQNGLVLNNQFSTKIDIVALIDEYVRTAVDEGTVVLKTGWEFREEEQMVEVEIPVMAVVPVADPMQAQQMIAQGMEPVEQIQVGTEIEMQPQMVTTRNQPTVEVCDYRNLVIDPGAKGDAEKARFIIYSFETSLAELEADGRYKNLDKINIEGANPLSEADYNDGEVQSFNFVDEPRKRFVAYEYWGFWDIEGDNMLKPIVATWVGDTMIRMEKNPYPDNSLPFITVQYLPVRKSNYGEPDGALLEDNQKVVGAVTRGMIDIMGRSANGQAGSRKDALDLTNKRKFQSGQDYEYNAGVNPQDAFYMHTYPEIPQSAMIMVQNQNMEAESLTGVKAFSGGISGAALGDTNAQVRGALDAASKRELGILRRLANGIEKLGRKVISMNSEFLSDIEVVRITNDEFVEVRRDDLDGSFDLRLEISTAEADDQKAQELAFMLQTMGNNMDPEMSKMILSDIARLRKMPTLAKRIEEYQPQPDPIAQEKAQLENELIKAQIAREYSIATENNSEIEVDQSTAARNYAQAEKYQSEADATDLQFVEQESGVAHERDLEKQSQQAQANTRMKVIDNAMKAEMKQKENNSKK